MINILTQGAITLAAWFIIMLICTNLIGFFVRKSFTKTEDCETGGSNAFIKGGHQKIHGAHMLVSIATPVLSIIFLIVLYYFWNIGLVVAALMLIMARIPDLIWEIEHGRELQTGDMTRPRFYLASTVLSWGSLLDVWYSLYRLSDTTSAFHPLLPS